MLSALARILVGAGDIASCDSEGDEITAGLLDEIVAGATEAVVFTVGDDAYEAGSDQSFYEAEAEIVVNAHDHCYERFSPQNPQGDPDDEGIRHFTVGTGRRSLAPFGPPAPNNAVRFNQA